MLALVKLAVEPETFPRAVMEERTSTSLVKVLLLVKVLVSPPLPPVGVPLKAEVVIEPSFHWIPPSAALNVPEDMNRPEDRARLYCDDPEAVNVPLEAVRALSTTNPPAALTLCAAVKLLVAVVKATVA